jgi:hypothetical protein
MHRCRFHRDHLRVLEEAVDHGCGDGVVAEGFAQRPKAWLR